MKWEIEKPTQETRLTYWYALYYSTAFNSYFKQFPYIIYFSMQFFLSLKHMNEFLFTLWYHCYFIFIFCFFFYSLLPMLRYINYSVDSFQCDIVTHKIFLSTLSLNKMNIKWMKEKSFCVCVCICRYTCSRFGWNFFFSRIFASLSFEME